MLSCTVCTDIRTYAAYARVYVIIQTNKQLHGVLLGVGTEAFHLAAMLAPKGGRVFACGVNEEQMEKLVKQKRRAKG